MGRILDGFLGKFVHFGGLSLVLYWPLDQIQIIWEFVHFFVLWVVRLARSSSGSFGGQDWEQGWKIKAGRYGGSSNLPLMFHAFYQKKRCSLIDGQGCFHWNFARTGFQKYTKVTVPVERHFCWWFDRISDLAASKKVPYDPVLTGNHHGILVDHFFWGAKKRFLQAACVYTRMRIHVWLYLPTFTIRFDQM